MASLRELRRRIKSVENINGITKAMELISAVRYKRIEKRHKQAVPYYSNLDRLVAKIVSESLCQSHPLFAEKDLKKELLIVVTGSRGLCGSFNSTVLKELQKYLENNSDREVVLYPIGKVGASFVAKRNYPTLDSWIDFGYEFGSADLKDILINLTSKFIDSEFGAIKILSTEMVRMSVYEVKVRPFLNLRYLMEQKSDDVGEVDYIFEPNRKETFDKLIDLYVKQSFFMALLGSVTAEYFARMMAMKQASDNGKEMIEDLTLIRNKVRQAMITNEISEIIGGVNALQ